jgi:hypothetical protein
MKGFWKGISYVLFYVIAASLLVYAASRSLDFIMSTLPGNQQVIGFLGLAATSGGMIAWLMLFMHHADGIGQKITSGLMVFIDMAGEIGLFTMDTLFRSGQSGMITSLTKDEIQTVIIGLSLLIAINIVATVAYHLLDNTNLRNMREGLVRNQLEAKALDEIEKRGEQLAHELAPKLAEQWVKEFEQRFSDFRSLGFGSSLNAKQPEAKAKPANDKSTTLIPYPILPPDQTMPMMAPSEAVVRGNGHSGNNPDPS